ncbi:MAG: hypothetical protein AB1634_15940, partial [Thermodesulfobacteriota bacterium]
SFLDLDKTPSAMHEIFGIRKEYRNYVHNGVIFLLHKVGLVGLGLFAVLLVFLFRKLRLDGATQRCLLAQGQLHEVCLVQAARLYVLLSVPTSVIGTEILQYPGNVAMGLLLGGALALRKRLAQRLVRSSRSVTQWATAPRLRLTLDEGGGQGVKA